MSQPNLTEAVNAMRSYQEILRTSPPNPNMMTAWIERQTNSEIATGFSHNAAIAILHYFSHPLYGDIANVPTDAQAWITYIQPAENIIANEETWIDMQITGAISTAAIRIFISDNQWLNQWASQNNFPPNTSMSYVINYLIASLRNCEGSNGPTGAEGISHEEHILPSGDPIP